MNAQYSKKGCVFFHKPHIYGIGLYRCTTSSPRSELPPLLARMAVRIRSSLPVYSGGCLRTYGENGEIPRWILMLPMKISMK